MNYAQSPMYFSVADTLELVSRADQLAKSTDRTVPFPLSAIIPTSVPPERWNELEACFIACIRANDRNSANRCLAALSRQFGDESERVLALTGMFIETAEPAEPDHAMKFYDECLDKNPSLLLIRKRRVGLLRSLNKTDEAVKAVKDLLHTYLTDAESWAMLAELQAEREDYSAAADAMQQVLVIYPNAWNAHAAMAEYLVKKATPTLSTIPSQARQQRATTLSETDRMKVLSEATRRFCRSSELCDNYARAFTGIKDATRRLAELHQTVAAAAAAAKKTKPADLGDDILSAEKAGQLNGIATEMLQRIATAETAVAG